MENVSSMYELSEAFHAISLRHTCILYIMEHFDKLSTRPGYVIPLSCYVPHLSSLTLLTWNFSELDGFKIVILFNALCHGNYFILLFCLTEEKGFL